MPSDIDDLRRDLDIVEVISEYINLERAGSNYKAHCPFHNDRTPSFYVSPLRRIFKCFGCGIGGDAIRFVSLYENISYKEAAIRLAERYGFKLKIEDKSPLKEETLNAISAVADFYHSKLKEHDTPIAYLRDRNIETFTVKKFGIGYSSSSEELVNMLRKTNILKEYERTGNLLSVGEGKYRDLFLGRLIIPVKDYKGRTVGFGGRLLKGEGPKYINSPESDFFKKRQLLFGLYEALPYLKDTSCAVLVEGYFDVMALHQEGFKNAVATLGTSLTEDHVRILSRFVKQIYIIFDADEAGRKALRLAVPHLLKGDLEVYPVLLPEGTDPHEFLIKEGRKALRDLMASSQNIFDLLLMKIREDKDTEQSVRDFLYFASFLNDGVKVFSLLTELSRITRIPLEILSEKIHRKEKPISQESVKLSFTERIFLKGLFELGVHVNLDQLNLSQKARSYAECILKEEYYEVPEEILNMKSADLQRDFKSALEALKVEIPKEEIAVTDKSLAEAVRIRVKNHKGGIKRVALKKWRGFS